MEEKERKEKKRKSQSRRGYYSELTTNLKYKDERKAEGLTGACKRTKLLWQVRTERHAPIVQELTKPTRPSFLAPAERWMCYEEEKHIVRINSVNFIINTYCFIF